ncbi:MAG: hypothetical protein AB1632_07870 [Nitrospirota bacterium]
MEIINEPIRVIASFSPSCKIRPVKFIWGKRTFEIEEITYQWKSREGKAAIYHFSVTDGGTLCEISFNADTLLWRLEALEAG